MLKLYFREYDSCPKNFWKEKILCTFGYKKKKRKKIFLLKYRNDRNGWNRF